MADPRRNQRIRKIQVGRRKVFGDDDFAWRAFLSSTTKKRSLKAMDLRELDRVIDSLAAKNPAAFGSKHGRGSYPGKPHNFNQHAQRKQLQKIEALLAALGKQWSYGESILKRISGGRFERFEFCTDSRVLAGVITALAKKAEKEEVYDPDA